MASKHLSHSVSAVGVAVVMLIGLPGCGTEPTPVPTPSPSVSANARVTVTQPSTAQLCFSPLNAFFFRLRLPVRFVESGGLGANVNFVRFSLWRGTTEVERREVTATDLQALGAQRIAANATVNATIGFDFNADADTWDIVRLEFNFTDDRGANSNAIWPDVNDLALSLPFCTI